jgi:hypothetical protein
MHIGFDISQTGAGKAGCGFFAHALIDTMLAAAPEHRYALYPSFGDFYFDARMPLSSPYRAARWPMARAISRVPRRRRSGTLPTSRRGWALPMSFTPTTTWCPTAFAASRVVYTCYDLSFAVDPSWTTEANRVGCFEGVFRAAASADWIVAISRASRDHYLSVFPHFPAERIRVIHPCSRFDGRRRVARRPGSRTWTTAASGSAWARSSRARTRRGWPRHMRATSPSAAGRCRSSSPAARAGSWRAFRARLESLGVADKVVMTGYVSDDELAWLYRNCFANLYPSLFEGFGLPVLEGLQFGAASIVSTSTSLPEAAGDAALLVAPEDTEGWARAMLRIANEQGLREQLKEAGPQHARKFDRKAAAAALLAVYDEARSAPKR